MIRGERVIQLNMALLIMAGALLLSIAQNDYTVFLITTLTVTFTLTVIDWMRLISFPPLVANFLAFVVTFFAFSQFVGGNAGTKLNAVANLLTYLQLVLLLQRKNPRLYWQVMMLSLLQVVVAAALNLEFSAGMVFLAYITLVVVGTIHLKIFRDNFRMVEAEKQNEERLSRSVTEPALPSDEIGVVTFRVSRLDFRNERKIAWQGFLLCLCSLFFAFAVFYSIPRFDAAWFGPSVNPSQQTGFTTEIRFDDDAFLRESNQPVFRASFLNAERRPMELAVEPYFRGLILLDYQFREGSWKWENSRNQATRRRNQGARNLPFPDSENGQLIHQVIRLEPDAKVRLHENSQDHLLFAVYPIFQNATTPEDVVYHRQAELIFRDFDVTKQSENGPYKYETLTPLYRNLGQLPATPYRPRWKDAEHIARQVMQEKNRLTGKTFPRFFTDWNPIRLKGIEIAKQLGDSASRRQICNRFVNYLKTPEFSYTRDLASIERDSDLDPIVDFLINHKTGHCEYFATALALLLRSQDIPCRLVSGFRGGDYNPLGGFYDVREKHAHVWVEAYLEPQDCDEDMLATGQASGYGSWLRLDPTPGGSEQEQESPGLLDQAFDAVGFAQKIWDDYVMGLDHESREFNGFDPTDQSAATWGTLNRVQQALQRVYGGLRTIPWWVWLVILTVIVFGILYVLYCRARKRLQTRGSATTTGTVWNEMVQTSLSTFRQFRSRFSKAAGHARQTVDFYEEFLTLMKARGLQRLPHQTQLEFARASTDSLLSSYPDDQQDISEAVSMITTFFYAQRFGPGLDASHLSKARQGLVQLKEIIG